MARVRNESQSPVALVGGWLSIVVVVLLASIAALEGRVGDAVVTAAVALTIGVHQVRLWGRGAAARGFAVFVYLVTIILLLIRVFRPVLFGGAV